MSILPISFTILSSHLSGKWAVKDRDDYVGSDRSGPEEASPFSQPGSRLSVLSLFSITWSYIGLFRSILCAVKFSSFQDIVLLELPCITVQITLDCELTPFCYVSSTSLAKNRVSLS